MQLQAAIDEADQGFADRVNLDFLKSKYLGRTMFDYFGITDPEIVQQSSKKKSPSAKSSKSPTKSDLNPVK